MPTPTSDQYLGAYRFEVKVTGIDESYFKEVEGLSGQMQVTEYREGGENSVTHMLPGPMRFSNLVLKRGFTASTALYDWFASAQKGKVERKTAILTVHDSKGAPKITITLKDAFPCRWEGNPLNSVENGLSVEMLELAHKGFEVKAG